MKLSRTMISWGGSLLWVGTPAVTRLLRWLAHSHSPLRPTTARTLAQDARPSKTRTVFTSMNLFHEWATQIHFCVLFVRCAASVSIKPISLTYCIHQIHIHLIWNHFRAWIFRGNTKSSNHQSSSSSSSSSLSSCSSSSALAHELVQTTVTETDTSSQVDWTYDPNEPRYCICNQVCSRHISLIQHSSNTTVCSALTVILISNWFTITFIH